MNDVLISRDELNFLLWDWLKLDDVLARAPYDAIDRSMAEAILDLSEQLAADTFLTHYKAADSEEPYLDEDGVHALPAIGDALRQYAELGLFSASFSPEIGGMGLPGLLANASFAQFLCANVATAAYPMLTTANARLIAAFGTEAQIAKFAVPQIAGEWLGTMCLSEPQAGSNLADVATRAMPDGDDEFGARHRLTGNKMWISGGDHDLSENIVHLVLAKVPDADGRLVTGTRGISLFIVPKILPGGARNDIAVAGLNHKMGYRGTTNCLLNLGEGAHRPDGAAGAIGWLVGEPGQGLPQMFRMMNEARIGVGLGAAALAYRGYRLALRYAQERVQGRPAGYAGTDTPAIIEHPDVKDMLLAAKCYAEGALALMLYCTRLTDDAAAGSEEAEMLLGLLTPIAKTWASEWGLAANDIAIQVHGGYGYTRDFDVEQLWRDNRLNPIHEGTTGIQGLDFVGRKLLRDKGEALALLREKVAQTSSAATAIPGLAVHGRTLAEWWDRLDAAYVIMTGSPDIATAHATSILRAFGHGVSGWLWLDRALLCADTPDDPFRGGKLWACRYFMEREMPRIDAWLRPVETGSDLLTTISSRFL